MMRSFAVVVEMILVALVVMAGNAACDGRANEPNKHINRHVSTSTESMLYPTKVRRGLQQTVVVDADANSTSVDAANSTSVDTTTASSNSTSLDDSIDNNNNSTSVDGGGGGGSNSASSTPAAGGGGAAVGVVGKGMMSAKMGMKMGKMMGGGGMMMMRRRQRR